MSRRMTSLLLALIVMLPTAVLAAPAGSPDPQAPVVTYYFHRTIRCQTCRSIEDMARYDVTVNLAPQVESGQLAWRAFNYELPENARYVAEFALESSSLIVARYDADELVEWTVLERVWELSDDAGAFDKYVLEAVEKYLATAAQATQGD